MSKKWRIPVEWVEFGIIELEGETLGDALSQAIDNIDTLPLPEGNYVDGSFRICFQHEDEYDLLNDTNMEYFKMFNPEK